MENPCFNCPDRHVGCHIDCDRRREWLDEHLERKRDIDRKRAAEGMLTSYQMNEQAKSKQHRRRKKS